MESTHYYLILMCGILAVLVPLVSSCIKPLRAYRVGVLFASFTFAMTSLLLVIHNWYVMAEMADSTWLFDTVFGWFYMGAVPLFVLTLIANIIFIVVTRPKHG